MIPKDLEKALLRSGYAIRYSDKEEKHSWIEIVSQEDQKPYIRSYGTPTQIEEQLKLFCQEPQKVKELLQQSARLKNPLHNMIGNLWEYHFFTNRTWKVINRTYPITLECAFSDQDAPIKIYFPWFGTRFQFRSWSGTLFKDRIQIHFEELEPFKEFLIAYQPIKVTLSPDTKDQLSQKLAELSEKAEIYYYQHCWSKDELERQKKKVARWEKFFDFMENDYGKQWII